MSYDVYLEADLGGPERVGVDGLDWNYTSNCAPMWRFAMPQTNGLAGMHDKRAGEVVTVLADGISYMERHAGYFRRMNPSNGWGDFDGQVRALRELLAVFRSAPDAFVYVSR